MNEYLENFNKTITEIQVVKLTNSHNIQTGLFLVNNINDKIDNFYKNKEVNNYKILKEGTWFENIKKSYLHEKNITTSNFYDFSGDILKQLETKSNTILLRLEKYEKSTDKKNFSKEKNLIKEDTNIFHNEIKQICNIFKDHINPLLRELLDSKKMNEELLEWHNGKKLVCIGKDEFLIDPNVSENKENNLIRCKDILDEFNKSLNTNSKEIVEQSLITKLNVLDNQIKKIEEDNNLNDNKENENEEKNKSNVIIKKIEEDNNLNDNKENKNEEKNKSNVIVKQIEIYNDNINQIITKNQKIKTFSAIVSPILTLELLVLFVWVVHLAFPAFFPALLTVAPLLIKLLGPGVVYVVSAISATLLIGINVTFYLGLTACLVQYMDEEARKKKQALLDSKEGGFHSDLKVSQGNSQN